MTQGAGKLAENYDLVVLGGGTGGYSAALHAANLGLSVALVDREKVGGTCLHWGCIPTKALLHAAEVYDTVRDAERFGIKVEGQSFDWGGVRSFQDGVVQKMYKGLQGLLRGRKVEVVNAEGTFTGPGTLRAGDRELQASNVVVATGSKPKMLPGLSVGPRIVTSDEALHLESIPKSVVVLGGGSVGVEFASVFSSFGAKVTVVEMLPTLVPVEDADLGKELAKQFRRRGITSMTNAKVEDVQATDDAVRVTVTTNGKTEQLEAEVLLVAVGRGPVTQGAGLEAAGLRTDERGYLPVDELGRTSQPNAYGIGDVIALPDRPHPQLAHTSFAEGITVAEAAAGRKPAPVNYDAIPRCTYCVPEVAAVGPTEAQARERGHDVVTDTVHLTGIGKAQILGQPVGFCKIVAEKGGAILGVHYIGPRVTELVAEAMLAVGWEAMPEEVAALIHPHPTLTESFGEAALALAGRSLHTA